MQKSDTILRAKHQHEETLRSLKERHDNEVFQLQQEIDRLNANAKRDENEKEHLRIRLLDINRPNKVMKNSLFYKHFY
jgi:hypothetical protein